MKKIFKIFLALQILYCLIFFIDFISFYNGAEPIFAKTVSYGGGWNKFQGLGYYLELIDDHTWIDGTFKENFILRNWNLLGFVITNIILSTSWMIAFIAYKRKSRN